MDVETVTCLVCGESHEVVARWGSIPIIHCPKVPRKLTELIVGDEHRYESFSMP